MNRPGSYGPRSSGVPRRPSRSSGSARFGGGERASSPRRSPSRKPRRGRLPAWLVTSLAGLLLSAALFAGSLWWWGRSVSGASSVSGEKGALRRVDLGNHDDLGSTLELLHAAGLTDNPTLLGLYKSVWRPFLSVEPGVHWVSTGHAPDALLDLLSRSRSREVVRVTLPEGWDAFQMAERLASNGICDGEEFLRAVFVGPTEAGGDEAESPWTSFEGRLYPAAYDFRLDTTAADVVARLVAEGDKRHKATFTTRRAELTRLQRELALTAQDVVTLASVVEKEAANEAELPLVASVFLNRLRDPDFRPARVLQSDPTAAYGCKRDPSLNSCRQFTGKVTAAMLRDPANAFNTYRHAGLPPTPIGNPSTRAIEAVLGAPATEYLFFVSPDGGPHRFSRTLEEHERHLR